MERAAVVLKQLADGTYRLPQGIDTQGTQAARTHIIDEIIKQFFWGPMENAVRRLLEHFRANGVALNPGVTRSALEGFGEAKGLQVPRILAELLLVGNGMQDGMDANGFRLWSVEEIIPLDQAFCADPTKKRPRHLVFLDYMAGTHGYALEVLPGGEGGEVLLADGAASRRVASSLADFWTAFVEDPLALI